MQVDEKVLFIINTLEQSGNEAYVVGGCVRDSLLGLSPQDWDICTSATPDKILQIFGKKNTIPTGLKHGTVTVLVGNSAFEVTTFRTDGKYQDGRHPQNVVFVKTLKDDLARRDFTINAMAFNPKIGVVDYFEGEKDLKNGVLRCVGKAEERFGEDALRILRALRFMAKYGFKADEELHRAIVSQKNLLKKISVERVFSELKGILVGDKAEEVLLGYSSVLAVFIPEIADAAGFAQNTPYHDKDVWKHTAMAVGGATPNTHVRLALLFHDLGKPLCYTEDAQGRGHFYGHEDISERIAQQTLGRLKSDTKTRKKVGLLVRYHDTQISVRRLPHWLNLLGEETLQELFCVKWGDAMAHAAPVNKQRLDEVLELEQGLQKLMQENACFRLKDLAVDGQDIIAVGVPEGGEVGYWLNLLLTEVLNGTLPNTKEALLQKLAILQAEQNQTENKLD